MAFQKINEQKYSKKNRGGRKNPENWQPLFHVPSVESHRDRSFPWLFTDSELTYAAAFLRPLLRCQSFFVTTN
jgi:hypothetical protein